MPGAKNKLVVAAAGSGKTTFLVEEALRDPTRKTLVTTYTEANEAEITRRFFETCKCIPAHVKIQTWFSFLIQHGVRPLQGCLLADEIKGLLLVNHKSAPFVGEDKPTEYYLSPGKKIYSDKLAKCVVRCDEKTGGAVIDRISRIFARILVDEAQDLAGYDLDVLKALFGSASEVILVGDPRQAVYLTHNEQRYKKYTDGKIREFVKKECRRQGVVVDDATLSSSYRSNQPICTLSNALYPDLKPTNSMQSHVTPHDGVFLVPKKHTRDYLESFKPMQLRMNRTTVGVDPDHPACNFGESKGLSFDRVLIHPTKDMLTWLWARDTKLAFSTRAKFYVALTRARHSVAIVGEPRGAAPEGVSSWP